MRNLQRREDLFFLVQTFYQKVRQDTVLGPIFNAHIKEESWPAHLEKLTDFWETNLHGVAKFKGNPTQKHIEVDKNLNYKTEQAHFGLWLNLWFQTIDTYFEGALANKAKEAARRMAHMQFMMIWKNRPKNQNT